uniref:Phosphate transporter n=1 Tax=Chromera velia CCMP2878 TaxID=1169474 RepID=A0A0G4HJQ5_9ALVE|eukprot:Cvel_28214.t1-p1 / transcript=Cvel_28214.t1 / gene=Cvel_28214 / organism=Chromera_velia_CCMP2878 / gene_product=Sodium-dependent phosphate transporter 2, putative / transcript_product=Sodium-dependent phosphate transporter 2, putative / location=Cvel_scaffold3651:5213-9103(+) / protein_length=641 / sequence_SO=supercontig / SO=protein_coding / is_pseudo=false
MVLHQFTWILVAGILAALFASFGIGANDVANAFATSVGAKSLTLVQAVIIAAVMEFAGAVLLGGSVANTIKKGVVHLDVFEGSPGYLMLAMLCSMLGSGAWLLTATFFKMPVSTTHSIVGAMLGVFLVAGGPGAVNWPTIIKIIVSWFTSPVISGLLTALLFFFVRMFLLRHRNSFERTCLFYPVLVGVTVAINVFFVIFKGMKRTIKRLVKQTGMPFPIWAGVLLSLGVGALAGLGIHFLLVPALRRRLDKWEREEEAKRQTREIDLEKAADYLGSLQPLGENQGTDPTPAPQGEFQGAGDPGGEGRAADEENTDVRGDGGVLVTSSLTSDTDQKRPVPLVTDHLHEGMRTAAPSLVGFTAEGDRRDATMVTTSQESKNGATVGETQRGAKIGVDISEQKNDGKLRRGPSGDQLSQTSAKTGTCPSTPTPSEKSRKIKVIKTAHDLEVDAMSNKKVAAIHDKAEVFDLKTEHMYGYLQVFTAIFDSFAHGSNDVANAVGPLAAIYAVFRTGEVTGKGGVPEWILAVGGGGIVFGLLFFGYRLIQVLGMELVKVTPSRGFSIELGTAFTTVVFSLVGVPISTTQCQVGSTAAMGWMEGRWDGVNIWVLIRTFLGWVITLVIAGCFSALLFSFAAFSPGKGA